MVKRVYAEMFQFMVNKINVALSSAHSGARHKFIGVLDIFGFESFAVNSFEQVRYVVIVYFVSANIFFIFF